MLYPILGYNGHLLCIYSVNGEDAGPSCQVSNDDMHVMVCICTDFIYLLLRVVYIPSRIVMEEIFLN